MGLYQPLTTEQPAWVVRKEDEPLLRRLNEVLLKWGESGVLAAVINRWIPVRISVEP